jgi:hypothetical protein
MSYYIVYSYNNNYGSNCTKYIMGIYEDLTKAKERQNYICGKIINGVNIGNGPISGNGLTTFVNVFPKGDCDLEMFTTSPSDDEDDDEDE